MKKYPEPTDDCRWLTVPYTDKDRAKQVGCFWSKKEKRWWAPRDIEIRLILEWLPTEDRIRFEQLYEKHLDREKHMMYHRQDIYEAQKGKWVRPVSADNWLLIHKGSQQRKRKGKHAKTN